MSENDEQGKLISNSNVSAVIGACWDELRETIGSTSAAVLLRRALSMSRDNCPVLEKITIDKVDRDYKYWIPPEVDTDPEACKNIRQLIENILSLLQKLTGTVLVNQLLANPIIRNLVSKEWRNKWKS